MPAYSSISTTLQQDFVGNVDETRRPSMTRVPIFNQEPPPDVLVLGEDEGTYEIASSTAECAALRKRLIDYNPPVDFPEDINLRFVFACELVSKAYGVIGREGILGMIEYMDYFESRLEPSVRPDEHLEMSPGSNIAPPPETLLEALANGRNGNV